MAKKGKRGKRKERGADALGATPSAAAGEASSSPAASPAPAQMPVAVAGSSGADPGALVLSGAARSAANVMIVLFLAYQVAMPLRYYLGGRGYDERFSWRMFSTLRMQRCEVEVRELVAGDERKVDLRKEVQVAWVGMMERYRRPVIDKVLARRCAKAKATKVRFQRRCSDTDGSALPETYAELACASGKIEAGEGAP